MSNNVEDWSTRKLKRAMSRYYRKVWYCQKYNLYDRETRKTLTAIRKELTHRGWSA